MKTLMIICLFMTTVSASAQECVDIAAAFSREYEKVGSQDEIKTETRANLCSSNYQSASDDEKISIQAAYEVYSGQGSYSDQKINEAQSQMCQNQYGSYWRNQVQSTEINRVSRDGADVVKACIDAQKFRITDLTINDESLSADFKYGGPNQVVLNGPDFQPSNIADCTIDFEGKQYTDLNQIANLRMVSGNVLTLHCTRKSDLIVGSGDTRKEHYPGGLVGIATQGGSAVIPLAEHFKPRIDIVDLNSIQKQIDNINAALVVTNAAVTTASTSIPGAVAKAHLDCVEATASGQRASCPASYTAVSCHAGGNRGSHSIAGNTCDTGQPGTDWTEATCCRISE